jgi:hypothetical protein
MNPTRTGAAAVAVCAALALLSCTSQPPVARAPAAGAVAEAPAGSSADLARTYAVLGAAGGKVMRLDPQASAVRIYVFRAGQAARVGHNHVLSAPQFTGYVYLPSSGTGGAHFDLQFRLDQLAIDIPEHRANLGPAFATELSAAAIEGTREHMLGEENMQADRFPLVTVHSLDISGESPRFAARIQVGMHGQTRDMWVPLLIEGLPGRLQVSGSFVLRQTDFGVRPYNVLGGLLAVQDEVVVDFKLLGS